MGDRITYVGLDVHKDGIVVALAAGGRRGEVDCAPFVHPRLASVEARIDAVGRVEVGIDLIRQEERLLDLAFGELHLLQRSRPIPEFVEAAEAVENAEPMSGDDGKDEAADGS